MLSVKLPIKAEYMDNFYDEVIHVIITEQGKDLDVLTISNKIKRVCKKECCDKIYIENIENYGSKEDIKKLQDYLLSSKEGYICIFKEGDLI